MGGSPRGATARVRGGGYGGGEGRLGFGERGEGDGAGREERETLERERRGIWKPLGCSFLILDDYNASVFIVLSRLASYVI